MFAVASRDTKDNGLLCSSPRDLMRSRAALLLFASLCSLLLSRPPVPAQEPPLAEPASRAGRNRLENRRSPVVELVARVKGAVVNIHSERTVQSSKSPPEHLALA